MQAVQIREKLHRYIEVAQEPQLQAIYILLEEKMELAEGHISIARYNEEIEASESRIDNGEYYTQEEIKRMSK